MKSTDSCLFLSLSPHNSHFLWSWCQSWMTVSTGRRNYLRWLDWLVTFVKQRKHMCKQWFRRNYLLSNQHLKMLPDLPASAAYVGIFRISAFYNKAMERERETLWNTNSLHAGLHGISFPCIVSLFASTLCAFASFYLSVVTWSQSLQCRRGDSNECGSLTPTCFATSDEKK